MKIFVPFQGSRVTESRCVMIDASLNLSVTKPQSRYRVNIYADITPYTEVSSGLDTCTEGRFSRDLIPTRMFSCQQGFDLLELLPLTQRKLFCPCQSKGSFTK